ncbi:MAG: 23S rRNA gene intervening protein [Parcubacteria group bacterium GW2011_GWA2_47_9]|nr:MAG: 23S rRNA gene intervening protein [Parcubacteria group bacterium GW2011_GWA2_47_9]
MIKDVEDLDVYNRSLRLLKPLGDFVGMIPKDEYHIRHQIMSAAHGIPAQIAEGFAKRRSVKECKRFWEMALGSSDEVITHIRSVIVRAFKNISDDDAKSIIAEYKIVSKQLNNLIKKWRGKEAIPWEVRP